MIQKKNFIGRLDDCWIAEFLFGKHKSIYNAAPGITGKASLDISALWVQEK
jgi:hypothetical protein